VEVGGERPWEEVLVDLHHQLQHQFAIGHVTLQPEPANARESPGAAAPSIHQRGFGPAWRREWLADLRNTRRTATDSPNPGGRRKSNLIE